MADSVPTLAPPPWTCDCSVHILPFYASASSPLPTTISHAPLEANDPRFSDPALAGRWRGGLAYAQVLQYFNTPVGSYNELTLSPGYFENVTKPTTPGTGRAAPEAPGSRKPKRRQKNHLKITGIWVDSEATVMNGRKNWGIPKHMARFELTFSDPKNPRSRLVEVKVFAVPPSSQEASSSTANVGEVTPAENNEAPFFRARFEPIAYAPPINFKSSWMDFLGFPTSILQPPIPTGDPPEVEVGTDTWLLSRPSMSCRGAKIIWIDMQQETSDQQGAGGKDEAAADASGRGGAKEKNWWPGMRRWNLGFWCPDTVLELGHPEII